MIMKKSEKMLTFQPKTESIKNFNGEVDIP